MTETQIRLMHCHPNMIARELLRRHAGLFEAPIALLK